MKIRRSIILSLAILVIAGSYIIYYLNHEAKYAGLTFVPEKSEDVPLYKGLEPDSPEYIIEGNHWEDILSFYRAELPENGWSEVMIQLSPETEGDGAGFMSTWQKEGQQWDLTIGAAYFKNSNQTEVIFDKIGRLSAEKWIETAPAEICINEQPDRNDDCFKMSDKESIEQVAAMVNEAFEWNKDKVPYAEKSVMDFGTIKVEVYYELDKGIYLVSEKGTKWMKPEREFFELTRISKEY